jgi:hypothetical protein
VIVIVIVCEYMQAQSSDKSVMGGGYGIKKPSNWTDDCNFDAHM